MENPIKVKFTGWDWSGYCEKAQLAVLPSIGDKATANGGKEYFVIGRKQIAADPDAEWYIYLGDTPLADRPKEEREYYSELCNE